MASCPSLQNVKLSKEGERALKDIKTILRNSKLLQQVLAGGTLINVIASDRVIPVAFNVTTTDWTLLGKAIKSVPAIAQNRIEQVAGMMALKSQGKENEFWKAIYNNCTVGDLAQ